MLLPLSMCRGLLLMFMATLTRRAASFSLLGAKRIHLNLHHPATTTTTTSYDPLSWWNRLRGGHQEQQQQQRNQQYSSSSLHQSSNAMSTASVSPPIAKREEDRVVYAGVAPEGWDVEKIPRQSAGSTEPLLDPCVAIPDPYGWMRDEKRTNQDVLDHLTKENAYTTALTDHLGPLRDTLYKEMVASIQETDYTTPRPHGEYYYYSRTIQGKSYTIYCRAPKDSGEKGVEFPITTWNGEADAPILPGEEVIIDVNKIAEGKKYCSMGAVKKSPSHKLLAYSADYTGGETCLFYVKDLATGEVTHHDEKLEISGSLQWGADDSTLFYLKLDAAHRPYQVYKRNINTSEAPNGADDQLLLEEPDDMYWMGISKTLDGRYLLVETSSKETSEYHFLDLHNPDATLQCIAPRRTKVLYDVDHRDGTWWISSNVGNLPNMALFTAPAVANCAEQWKLVTTNGANDVLFPGSYERSLDHVTCFANHVVASGREGGLPRVWVLSITSGDVQNCQRLTFAEEAYDVGLGAHYEFDTTRLVVGYDSMVTPAQSLEIDMADVSQRKVLKEKKVPGYDKALYGTERTTVTARDGTEVPVTLVYRKDVMEQHKVSGQAVPTHLYGYGSYGACMEADFRATRLALLNRGLVYVVAHIRGGGEMGRQWYEEPNGAKYLCKKNTFNDFVDVGRWLVENRKLTSPEVFSCEGRSAGGLLIGATINQAPELFKVAVLGVPFVDVVPTMIDASIPLTAVEWEEWGNPNEVKYHQYMMEYSPTQNIIKGGKYPACLLTGGLHDPRVQYWEPSKFAAALRHEQDSEASGPVCVKMDMSAGHFSASDRYKYLKELSFDFAFMLDQLGLANVEVPANK